MAVALLICLPLLPLFPLFLPGPHRQRRADLKFPRAHHYVQPSFQRSNQPVTRDRFEHSVSCDCLSSSPGSNPAGAAELGVRCRKMKPSSCSKCPPRYPCDQKVGCRDSRWHRRGAECARSAHSPRRQVARLGRAECAGTGGSLILFRRELRDSPAKRVFCSCPLRQARFAQAVQ